MEEENMDVRADKAEEHAKQLKRDRESVLERIEGYYHRLFLLRTTY